MRAARALRSDARGVPAVLPALATGIGGNADVFITRLNSSGSDLLDSTYLGGSSQEYGQGIAVDTVGNAYIVRHTLSTDFPTTPHAFDPSADGGLGAFVTTLNPSGTAVVDSTFLSGSLADSGHGSVVDDAGSAYVAGSTTSSDFPATPGAFDQSYNGSPSDGFVTKLASGRLFLPSVFR